jgi:hypothetical protein
MRILTAGFDHARSEQLGERLTDAGHRVMSASGVSSCRTLASSITPDVMLIPEGPVGDDADSWAADLLEGTHTIRLAEGADPVAALDGFRGPRRDPSHPTEQLDEDAIVAAIESADGDAQPSRRTQRSNDTATEHLNEAALLASIDQDRNELATLPNPPVPSVSVATLETPRRSVTLLARAPTWYVSNMTRSSSSTPPAAGMSRSAQTRSTP